ncbi:hypothetical protein OTB20_41135 [Streptomyces sp. H27-H1]|uniref:hypothetical protein n=1 Tax=Streptomyces sp. H27-H1 TaxID=2996461 RepID=UPI00226ECD02|nr:hypothetical protein [Streptomyces sp. H27-H1]MCY0932438.1 hypothetical protein [Streptomyces sp. H27-H1]
MEELREDQDDGTVARVAAIHIAKASGMVCLRVPHDSIEGRRIQQVWNDGCRRPLFRADV